MNNHKLKQLKARRHKLEQLREERINKYIIPLEIELEELNDEINPLGWVEHHS